MIIINGLPEELVQRLRGATVIESEETGEMYLVTKADLPETYVVEKTGIA